METTDEGPSEAQWLSLSDRLKWSWGSSVVSNILAEHRKRDLPLEGSCNWKENRRFGEMIKDQFVRDSDGRALCHPWRLVGEAMVRSGRGVSLFIQNVVFHLNYNWKPLKGWKQREDTIKVAILCTYFGSWVGIGGTWRGDCTRIDSMKQCRVSSQRGEIVA